jgi:hypothetical protein
MPSENSRGTDRAFIAFVCKGCNARDRVDVTEGVRAVVRHCSFGVLAESECILGEVACGMQTSGNGVIVAVQPTSPDYRATGRPLIRGPLATNAELTEFCFWLESGSWS